jgi:two-component system CheB/CheR fusion protein
LASAAIARFLMRLRATGIELESEINRRMEAEGVRAALLEQLLRTQEEERGRFAKELHDQMGQQLSALVLGLEALRRHLPSSGEAATHRHDLDKLQGIADQLIDDVHFVAWELRPAALYDFGLHGALGNLAESLTDRSGVAIEFYSNLGKRRLPWQIEATLYRVAQEALTNVAKHARARTASVVLMSLPGQLRLVVEDEG